MHKDELQRDPGGPSGSSSADTVRKKAKKGNKKSLGRMVIRLNHK